MVNVELSGQGEAVRGKGVQGVRGEHEMRVSREVVKTSNFGSRTVVRLVCLIERS